jgi:hypothetical protein
MIDRNKRLQNNVKLIEKKSDVIDKAIRMPGLLKRREGHQNRLIPGCLM